jgi:hypothetical protein
MAKFDPSRVTGGTIELVRNPDGSYKSQVTGFNQIASLNLPDLTATTTTSEATTTAAEKAQENLQTQTSTAFKMPTVMEGDQDNQQDFSGSMTKEAAQTSKLLTETFNQPIEIKSPTAPLYDDMEQTTAAQTSTAEINQPELGDTGTAISNILNEAKVKEDDATITLSKARIRGPRDLDRTQTTTTRTPQGFDPLGVMSPKEQRDQRFTDDAGLREPPAYDYPDLGPALGITTDTKTTAPDAITKEPKKQTLGITVDEADVEADLPTATRQPTTESKKTFFGSIKRAFDNIPIPSIAVTAFRAIARPETPTQKHAKSYFNVRDDGRIAGNPNIDLFAGFNRVSAFGNLSRAGQNRIDTREKTISKKGYGPGDKFYDDTQKMKDQLNNYNRSKNQSLSDEADQGERGALSDPDRSVDYGVTGGPTRTDIDVADSGAESSGGGGKIVCTMMNKSYGFGSFRNKIWLRHSKNLAPEYQIGYHKIFLPLVKKSKTNKFIKKILEHIAIHRTIDIRKEEKNKIHLLGRIYRKILEPICYLVGRLWR